MSPARGSDADGEHLRELFASFGPVSVRRMFGGIGVYADGLMFALVAEGIVYLKADDETIPAFERERSAPFSYVGRNGRSVSLSYWRLPDRLYDDADTLAEWARAAVATARRASAVKQRRARRRARTGSHPRSRLRS
jgi:DNA transformation protein